MSPPSILKNYDDMDIKHFEYERTMAQWNIKRVDILYQQNLEILRDLKSSGSKNNSIKGANLRVTSEKQDDYLHIKIDRQGSNNSDENKSTASKKKFRRAGRSKSITIVTSD